MAGRCPGELHYHPEVYRLAKQGTNSDGSPIYNTTGSDLTPTQIALEMLNIPVVEIGRANLENLEAHSAAITNAYMKNVVFFDYARSAADPRVFAANQVGGTYSGSVAQGDFATVSGNGLQATMTMDHFNEGEGQWGAFVRGGGTAAGISEKMDGRTIWMEGGAAGTAGDGIFSGSAAGVAGAGTNPYPTPAP